jgi:hypothetical protein
MEKLGNRIFVLNNVQILIPLFKHPKICKRVQKLLLKNSLIN